MKNYISKNRQFILLAALFFWGNLSFAYSASDTEFLTHSVTVQCIGASESSITGSNFSHCTSITAISPSQNITPEFQNESPDNIVGDHYQFYLYQRIKKPPRFLFTPFQKLRTA